MRLGQVMEEKGIKISELALQSGLSVTYIKLLLENKKSPTLRTLEKLANALGVDIYDLIKKKAKASGE